jgi:phosphopantetheine binding protein
VLRMDVTEVVDVFRRFLPDCIELDAGTDFFEVGGNSILAARVVANLRERSGAAVSMRDFFRARTPEAMADRIHTRLAAGSR